MSRAMNTPVSLWGAPEAALAAMRAGCWQRDAELAALQSALWRDEPASPAAPRGAPDLRLARGAHVLPLQGREIRVAVSMQLPRLLLLDGVLDDDECEALIRTATPRLERSRTLGAARDELSEARTSHEVFLDPYEDACCRHVEDRLHALFDWPRAAGEPLQVVRYGPGEEFRPHHDYFDAGSALDRPGTQRVATVICYLNRPARGGHTRFPGIGLDIVPRRGAALFFSYEQPSPATRTLHAGMPVLQGTKWIATKWFTQP
jgi:prolyl 4-hydroxylase